MEYSKQKTIDAYNKNATYHASRFTDLLDISRRKEFSVFLDLLPGKDILDIGCGSGDHALYFREQGLRVTAIDISEGMVQVCKEKGIDAQIMDVEEMTFQEKSFDGIWSVASLLHVAKKDLPSVIEKIHALLRENGIFYVCLKEGEGERMVPDENNCERFFAFWKSEEILSITNQYFDRIPFGDGQVTVNGRTFIQLFFKKK